MEMMKNLISLRKNWMHE